MLRDADDSAGKPSTMDARHGGLTLVWSRDRPQMAVVAKPVLKRGSRFRERREVVMLSLATAAAIAPMVWLAHSFLRYMKVL